MRRRTPNGKRSYPKGVYFDGQRLFIADDGNNRVLVYNSLPVTNNAPANEVIGQPNFTSNSPNQGLSAPTSQTLNDPEYLWANGTSLFVSDSTNNRVLIYNNQGQGIDTLTGGSAGVTADGVVGQNSFVTYASGSANNALNYPMGVYADNCELFIADYLNYRVLDYYGIPTGTTNPSANLVFGGANNGWPTQNNFTPGGVQIVNGTVWLADIPANRVLQFSCQAGTGYPNFIKNLMKGPMFTPTVTPTLTETITPTATINPDTLTQSVVAAPNVSRDGEPVDLRVALGHAAQIHLSIYNMVGEQVYETTMEGTAGVNDLLWQTENQIHSAVASGLYIYVLQIDDSKDRRKYTGKIAVIR